MKTKLLTICLLLFTSQVFADEITVLKNDGIEIDKHGFKASVTIFCIGKHKFVTTTWNKGISTVQIFEERNGKSLPVKCNK